MSRSHSVLYRDLPLIRCCYLSLFNSNKINICAQYTISISMTECSQLGNAKGFRHKVKALKKVVYEPFNL